MAKVFIAIVALFATSLAEPPVNSYLSPSRSAQPSSHYGAPDSFNEGFGLKSASPSTALESYNSRNGQAPSNTYGVPDNSFGNSVSQPSNTYGTPDQFSSDFGSDSVTIEAASRFASFNGARQPSSTYGAPSQRFEQQPSQSYGAPSRSSASFRVSSGFGQSASVSSRFGQPSSTYGAPSRSAQPSNTHGIPNGIQSNGASVRGFGGSNSHGAFSSQAAGRYTAAIPSNNYGAPSNGFNGGFGKSSSVPSTSYGAPTNGFNGAFGKSSSGPSTSYGAPTNGFNEAFGKSSSGPSTSYGAPTNGFNGGFTRSSQSSFPAPSLFNAPSNHIDAGYSRQPSSEYGTPGYARKATTEDPLAEPAHYQYNYEVRDEEQISGAEFGHQESRENESARGAYHVLLPDGRMQIVEYEADEGGYRPNIRYEETGAYPSARSGQNGQGGY